MKFLKKFIPLLILVSGYGFSQNLNNSAPLNGKYLVFDASKSFQGNELFDHLQFLISNSEEVSLPGNVKRMLDAIQDELPLHEKLNYMRGSILKVLYNEQISPEDKKFICNHYLQEFYQNDDSYKPIVPLLQTYMEKGSL